MDTSNWRPDQGGSGSMDSVDWRTQLQSDTRNKIVFKITDTLNNAFSGTLPELKKVAMKFEEKIYAAATSHEDYMRKISVKLLTLMERSTNLTSNSSSSSVNPSDPGSQGMQQVNNQSQPLTIPVPSNHPQSSQQILSQSIHNNNTSSPLPPGSSTISNISSQNPNLQNMSQIFFNQRQIPGRKQQQQQRQNSHQYLYRLHPITKQNLQQNYGATSAQSHIHQQNQNLLQHHQQSGIRQQKQQQPPHTNPMGQQTSATNLQHKQLINQQNNLLNVQQPHQHAISQHNNYSAMHAQHLGPHGGSSTGHQHSTHVMQSKVSIPQQNQSMQGQRSQPELQTGQLNIKLQPNMLQREMQQRIPTLGMYDQQKQLFQQQRAMPEASSTSSESTAQTGNPNSGDWQEEVYQKLKVMKDKYMLDLRDFQQKLLGRLHQYESRSQQPESEQYERIKGCIHQTERYMAFLQVPKTNISPTFREKVDHYETLIANFITGLKRKPGPHHPQQLPMPHQQQPKPHENHMFQHQQQPKPILHRQMQQPQYLPKQQINRQQPKLIQLPHMGIKIESLQRSQLKPAPQIPSPNNIDQNSSVTKSGTTGTPLQSANSPFTMSSPSTPSTSHVLGESEKVNSGISSLSNAGNVGHQQNVVQSLPFGTPGISASPLLAEFAASPDGNNGNDALVVSGKSSAIQQPIEHLLKVVKSISAKSLSASVGEIGSVVSMIDSIAGSEADKQSRSAVGEDLVATTKCHLQARTTRKMKRLIMSTMPLNVVSSASGVTDSFNCLEASELESTATSTVKRPRIEKSNVLLEEIRGINQKLIDTVLNISEEDTNNPAGGSELGKGTVVSFSFSAVALCPNIKSKYASTQMSLVQPLQLLVPTNYPICSPILLDKFPVDDSKEYEDLSMKAKRRFGSCIRRLSDPMSLEEMARTWDVCARAVISEYAHQSGGGGTFTSKYGAWEDCLTFNDP